MKRYGALSEVGLATLPATLTVWTRFPPLWPNVARTMSKRPLSPEAGASKRSSRGSETEPLLAAAVGTSTSAPANVSAKTAFRIYSEAARAS
jgi:hypothetical protein